MTDQMTDPSIGTRYNIEPEVALLAMHYGLHAIATGGNIDYICCPDNPNVILSSIEPGWSPDSIYEQSLVTMYTDRDWDTGISLTFNTALDAMAFMKEISNKDYYGFPQP